MSIDHRVSPEAPLRAAWIGTIAAPYREGLWRELSKLCDLSVYLLAPSEPGRFWADGSAAGAHQIPGVVTIPIGDVVLYGLRRRPSFLARAGLHAVVLPGWEMPATWQLLRAARRWGVATVGYYELGASDHRFPRGPIDSVRTRFFRLVDRVVCAGPVATEAVRAMRVGSSGIFTGMNAVDGDWFAAESNRQRTIRPTEKGHRFLFVGRLIPLKNVDRLLRAFSIMRDPNDTLTLAGDGPMHDELRSLRRALGLERSVRLTGNVLHEHLPSVYAEHDTLVLPSSSETWGLVVNEALSCGLSVVVSSAAGAAAAFSSYGAVRVTGISVPELAISMSATRHAWEGAHADRPILNHTNEQYAATFHAALASATATRHGKQDNVMRRARFSHQSDGCDSCD